MKSWIAGVVGALVGGALVGALDRTLVSPASARASGGAAQASGEASEGAGASAAAGGRSSDELRRAIAGSVGAGGVARGDRPVDDLTPAELKARYIGLLGEVIQLRDKLDAVEGGLHRSVDKDRAVKPYDMSKEQLLALADRCALSWDMPSLGDKAVVSAEDARALGISDAEQAQIDKVLGDNDAYMKTEMRKLYIEVTGDEANANNLAAQTLQHEIEDKSPKPLLREIFKKIAAERAGLQPPPKDDTGESPAERLYRLLTGAGDRVEKNIAGQVGSDIARRYRDLQNGFSSRSTSSWGCPTP